MPAGVGKGSSKGSSQKGKQWKPTGEVASCVPQLNSPDTRLQNPSQVGHLENQETWAAEPTEWLGLHGRRQQLP